MRSDDLERPRPKRDPNGWGAPIDWAAPSPRALSPVPTRPNRVGEAATLSEIERRVRISQAFTPAAPVASLEQFAGRRNQLETLIDVVYERGQHAILYGERGVGKTSLASMLTKMFADDPSKAVIRINCDATDDFTSLWQKIVDDLDMILSTQGAGRDAVERMRGMNQIAPNDVRRLLRAVSEEREPVILLDEFDTITHAAVTPLIADTIKTLSDQTISATLVIIGVADNLDELLAEHGSINRSLVGVHMPRMTSDELKELVQRGLRLVAMDIDVEALELIADLSQGFPHFAHLLTQASARAAADEGRSSLGIHNLENGIRRAIQRIEAWISQAYDRATAAGRETIYAQVVLGAVLAPKDHKGYFVSPDVSDPLSEIIKRRYNLPSFTRQLNALCEDKRGPIFMSSQSRRGKLYRFLEPHMEPYVLMRTFATERTTSFVRL